jgi:protease YdgD
MKWAAALFAALCSATQVSADASPLRSLDREYEARSWRAVGRIDLGNGRAFCSGTLIAPDLVLTAAHCLYKPGSSERFAPEDIVFRAGLRAGKAEAMRRAKAAEPHAAFVPGNRAFANVVNDVGLIRLAKPIPSYEIPPFKLHMSDVRSGEVSVVSYGRGRSETQSRQNECNLTERVQDVVFFDCDSVPGTSGAPVFSHRNGRGEIVAVVSGSIPGESRHRTVGMVLTERVAQVKRQLRMQVRGPVAKVRRLGAGERNSGGAKFVRSGGS